MGTVWVNSHGLRDPAVPTGGCKESGSSWHGGLDVSAPPHHHNCVPLIPVPTWGTLKLMTQPFLQGLYEYLQPSGTPERLPFEYQDLNYDSFGLTVPVSLPAGPETGPR